MNTAEIKAKYLSDAAMPGVNEIRVSWEKAVAKAKTEVKAGGLSKATAANLYRIYKQACSLDDAVSALRNKIVYENLGNGISVAQLG